MIIFALVGGGLLLWTVWGYPTRVSWLVKGRGLPPLPPKADPYTVILVVHNEEARLRRKLEELCAIEDPACRRLLIVDDGSDDGTHDILAAAARADGRLLILRQERGGKSRALNRCRGFVHTPVAMLMDVRQKIAPESLHRLVGRVSRGSGLEGCSGRLVPEGGTPSYWDREARLRWHEGILGRTIGLSGSGCALRRDYWVRLPDDGLVDDLALGLGVLARGGRVALDPGVILKDDWIPTPDEEMARKIRTLSGNWDVWRRPWRYELPRAAEHRRAVWSHKFSRLLLPLDLFLLSVALGGAWPAGPLAVGAAAMMVMGSSRGRRLARDFCLLTAAAAVAAVTWRRHASRGLWDPQGRGSK